MKESMNQRLVGASHAAFAAAIFCLFMADKKAELNLYFADEDLKDANDIQKTIEESVRKAFVTETDSNGNIQIEDNMKAQMHFARCMSIDCTPPTAGELVSDSDSWPTICRKAIGNEINSWEIRDQANSYHSCMVNRMNCVHEAVMPYAK